MKKTLALAFVLAGGMESYAQMAPNGTCQGTFPANPNNMTRAWLRGGNQLAGAGGNDNRFGTCYNSPIYTITNSIFRTKLNGNVTYDVNGFNQARNGYFLLGQDGNSGAPPLSLYNSNVNGAFSLLHLNGPGNFVQEGGFRDWMQTGITFTSNNDLAYMGHRQVNNMLDITETVIAWSDNTSFPSGRDVMSFRFTTGDATPGGTPNGQDLIGTDNNGREIMRMMGGATSATDLNGGNIGIGPRFGQLTTTTSIDPQSRLHQHHENAGSSWYQISNQAMTTGGISGGDPTAVGPGDGLRMGILGHATDIERNGVAMLYNQELRPLLFSTNANTSTVNAVATQERFRIMSYNTPTALGGANYGPYTPYGTIPVNATRTAISHDPANPLTRPLSLLHLGFNNNTGVNTFGHRQWMDVGTFTSQANDHMYVGLKTNPNGTHDAIVNWGTGAGFNAPDVLRFTFTQPTLPVTGASDLEGLEIARMWSDGTIGRTGFGNFFDLGFQPQNTVHINSPALDDQTVGGSSGLRLQDLTSGTPTIANPGLGVLAVNASGDVIYVEGGAGSTLGGLCGTTPAGLAGDWEIPMNANNFVFTDPTPGPLLDGENFVGIGTGCTPAAKLEVIRGATTNSISTVVGTRVQNSDVATTVNYMGFGQGTYSIADGANRENSGVYGEAKNGQTNFGVRALCAEPNTGGPAQITNIGVNGEARDAISNVGVSGAAASTNANALSNTGVAGTAGSSVFNTTSRGGSFTASSTRHTFGTHSTASNGGTLPVVNNIGSFNIANTFAGATTFHNIGVVGIGDNLGGTVTHDYGVYGEGATFGGYFVGGTTGGPAFLFSDQKIKENVKTIESGLELLKKLNPVTYDHKTSEFPELHLREGQQYGFIAQEVAEIMPSLVVQASKPEFTNEKGEVLSKGVELKALNYDGLIPVLTKSIQEQQEVIEKLQDEVAALKSVLTAATPAALTNDPNVSIELSDARSIVLDQNTPNPFAEQTTITYTLTDGVSKAQILFYNAEGKLINSVDLENKAGKGSVHVFANDLSNGLYTYTLVVDGKIIDTKRMIRNK